MASNRSINTFSTVTTGGATFRFGAFIARDATRKARARGKLVA